MWPMELGWPVIWDSERTSGFNRWRYPGICVSNVPFHYIATTRLRAGAVSNQTFMNLLPRITV